MRRGWIAAAVMLVYGAPVQAETVQDQVLACFEQMNETTDWNGCLNTLFSPCEGQTLGSDPHLECLIGQSNDWRAAQVAAETEVMAKLTKPAGQVLTGLLEAWPKFVEEKCSGVAQGRAQISFEAALIGCQISEYALMTNELTSCLEGRSVEEYCVKNE